MNDTYRCIVVDDEPLAIDVIKNYIGRVPQLEYVDSCSDALSAFSVLNQKNIDLIFLDIEMPELNGIQFLKSLSDPPAVILTTAYREYALESYEVEVVDYLLKPISFNRFFKGVAKFLNQKRPQNLRAIEVKTAEEEGSIFVYADKKNVKVFFDEILYVESIKDYVRIHTAESNIISKSTITAYENLLPAFFLRVHRSFIVNTKRITAFTQHDIEIDQKEIPIGVSYKKSVMALLKP